MKKTLGILLALLVLCAAAMAAADVPINANYFPDEWFRAFLSANVDSENSAYTDEAGVYHKAEKDGILNDLELSRTKLIVNAPEGKNITSLEGIQYFTKLETLECNGLGLKSLDLSRNTSLKDVFCRNNQLESLNIGGNTSLATLDCSNNQLTALDLSHNTELLVLTCYKNKIAKLDVSASAAISSALAEAPVASKDGYHQWSNRLSVDPVTTVTAGELTSESHLVFITEQNFPDPAFRATLLQLDVTNDGAIDDRAEKITALNVSGKEIASLQGIELFPQLITLDCTGNHLTKLDFRGNPNLKELKCSDNKLESLDLSQNTALQVLSCFNNQLKELSLNNQAELTKLTCYQNGLSALDVSGCPKLSALVTPLGWGCNTITAQGTLYHYRGSANSAEPYLAVDPATDVKGPDYTSVGYQAEISETNFPDRNFCTYISGLDKNKDGKIDRTECPSQIYVPEKSITLLTGIELIQNATYIDCHNNGLTSLDLSRNTALSTLICWGNALTSLDLSQNTKLKELDCRINHLNTLNVTKNTELTKLFCSSNALISVDLSGNAKLQEFTCSGNSMTALDVSKNAELVRLECEHNTLTALDLSKNQAIEKVACSDNKLTTLKVAALPRLMSLSCSTNEFLELNLKGSPQMDYLLKEGQRQDGNTTSSYELGAFKLVLDSYVTIRTDSRTIHPTGEPNVTGTQKDSDGNIYNVSNDKTAVLTIPANKKATELVIPDTFKVKEVKIRVTAIDVSACAGMSKLKKVTIGKNVQTIGENAFNGCKKLAEVIGGTGVTTIGEGAFRNCKALEAFTFHTKVSRIGRDAFNGCKQMETIVFKTKKLTKKNSIGIDAFKGTPKNATVTCPAKVLKKYTTLLLECGINRNATIQK